MKCPVCDYKDYISGSCPSCGTDSSTLIRLSELPHIYYNKAVELIEKDRLEESKEALIAANELAPNDVEALILLGRVCAELGNYEKALLYWDNVQRIDKRKAEEIKRERQKAEDLMNIKNKRPLEKNEEGREGRRDLAQWAGYAMAILLVIIMGLYFSFRKPVATPEKQGIIATEKNENIAAEIKKLFISYKIHNIAAEEREGIVYLNGKVSTLWDKQKIEDAVREIKGLKIIDMRGIEVAYPRGYYYKIKKGESLWIIAEKVLGDGNKFEEIYKANKGILKEISKIQAGERLLIPE